ncbi:hypothetical protein [Streptomyces sp. NPDC058664]|uniref:hypothetical protein n=1 Tax=unclassified Streptomyces TaxID=2593676 RepID=UPI00365A82ED
MLLAGGARERKAVTGCRIAADTSDALLFGTLLKDRDKRWKVAGFAFVWAALCAASLSGMASSA